MKFILSGKKLPLTDEDIVLRYKSDRDQKWIDLLFDRYSHLTFAVAFNYLKDEEESKDAVLEIFQKLSTDLLKYDIRQFHSWLHRVVKNHSLRMISRKMLKEEVKEERFTEVPEQEDVFEKYFDHLKGAISELNEEQRICIEMFYLQKRTYREISDQTSYELNKVKSYIQNGKRNLRILLERRAEHD